MLKIEKQNGAWQARIVGKPDADIRRALMGLARELAGATACVREIIESDPCGQDRCAGCVRDCPDPAVATAEFAADCEIEYAVDMGLSIEEVEHWDEVAPLPIDPAAEGDAKVEGSLDGARG